MDGKIGEAHGGLGYMVYATGATVLPIAINTLYKMSFKEYFCSRRKVVITICKPLVKNDLIFTPKPTVPEFRLASQKVLDKIQEVLD